MSFCFWYHQGARVYKKNAGSTCGSMDLFLPGRLVCLSLGFCPAKRSFTLWDRFGSQVRVCHCLNVVFLSVVSFLHSWYIFFLYMSFRKFFWLYAIINEDYYFISLHFKQEIMPRVIFFEFFLLIDQYFHCVFQEGIMNMLYSDKPLILHWICARNTALGPLPFLPSVQGYTAFPWKMPAT